MNRKDSLFRNLLSVALATLLALVASPLAGRLLGAQAAPATQGAQPGGEANLVIPDLGSVEFLGVPGSTLLMAGLVVCALGLLFGLVIYGQLKRLPVHESMLEISELIYETCKTYLTTQGKFILMLWVFIGSIVAVYFGTLAATTDASGALVHGFPPVKVAVILAVQPRRHCRQLRRRVVRHPREHVRELAHGVREPPRQAVPVLRDSAAGGHEHRHAADLRRAGDHAVHPALRPGRLRRPVLHRLRDRRIARRRSAARRRRHLHEDRRHRRRSHEDRLQDQGRRRAQSRRDRRLHRRQRRRLGRSERRRLRDLRRDWCRAHLVHPARGESDVGRPGVRDGSGPASRLDLRHAHHDGGGERRVVPHQRGDREGAVRATPTR